MEKPTRVERYGKQVWECTYMDLIRKDMCMCLDCGKFKPGQPDHCPIATDLFEVCKKHGNAFMMTRCPIWEPKGGQKAP